MFIRVIDHYQDEDNNVIQNNDTELTECFVCYEIQNENNCLPIRLYKQTYYTKYCNCDGVIHKKCLDKWFRTNKTCPICRNNIYENVALSTSIKKHNQFGHVIFYFVLLKRITRRLLNYFSHVFLIFFIFKMYLSVMDKLYFVYNEGQILNDKNLLN